MHQRSALKQFWLSGMRSRRANFCDPATNNEEDRLAQNVKPKLNKCGLRRSLQQTGDVKNFRGPRQPVIRPF